MPTFSARGANSPMGRRLGGLAATLAPFATMAALALPLTAADAPPTAPPAPPAPAAGAAGAAMPKPTRIGVIFLDQVQSLSDRRKEIQADLEQRTAMLKAKQQALVKVLQNMDEIDKNMRNGIGGDMVAMQERWLSFARQKFQMDSELKDLTYRLKKEFAQKVVALKTDINAAIATVAKAQNLDIVMIRKDAEAAAVEAEKAKNDLLGKKNPDDKTTPTDRDKLEKELDHEMTQKMLSKLENTFVWSNDSMDITGAVVTQLADNFKNKVLTPWDQIKLPEEGPDTGAGAGGAGAGGGAGGVPEE